MPFSGVYPVSVAAAKAAHFSWWELNVRQCQHLLNREEKTHYSCLQILAEDCHLSPLCSLCH